MDLLNTTVLLCQAGQYLFESRITTEAYSVKLAYAIAINWKIGGNARHKNDNITHKCDVITHK